MKHREGKSLPTTERAVMPIGDIIFIAAAIITAGVSGILIFIGTGILFSK